MRLVVEGFLGVLDGQLIIERGWNYGLDWASMIPIATSSIGGIGIGYITKYAGVIAKSYSLIGAIMLSGIVRSLFYDAPMSVSMGIAVPLVMISLYLKNDPNIHKNKKENNTSLTRKGKGKAKGKGKTNRNNKKRKQN